MSNYFEDRVVQYPGRVTLTPTEASDTYDVARAEGTVTTAGTPFNAETFNEAVDLYAMWYGTCSTGANTAVKEVVCPGFSLTTGATITVLFDYGNTYNGYVSLNVNNTGAKDILCDYLSTGYNYKIGEAWGDNVAKTFVYDGNRWRIIQPNIITKDELYELEALLGISS